MSERQMHTFMVLVPIEILAVCLHPEFRGKPHSSINFVDVLSDITSVIIPQVEGCTHPAASTFPKLPFIPVSREMLRNQHTLARCSTSTRLQDKRPHLRQCHPLQKWRLVVTPSAGNPGGTGSSGRRSPAIAGRFGAF